MYFTDANHGKNNLCIAQNSSFRNLLLCGGHRIDCMKNKIFTDEYTEKMSQIEPFSLCLLLQCYSPVSSCTRNTPIPFTLLIYELSID